MLFEKDNHRKKKPRAWLHHVALHVTQIDQEHVVEVSEPTISGPSRGGRGVLSRYRNLKLD